MCERLRVADAMDPDVASNTCAEILTLSASCAGVDYTHPDLKDQIDHSQSASCVGGKLNTTQAAYLDTFGHGTCVAASA